MEDLKQKILDIYAVVSLILLFLLTFFVGRCTAPGCSDVPTADTVTIHDTIRYDAPPPVHDTIYKRKVVPVVMRDTISQTDTLIVVHDSVAVIPIHLRTYTDSSTYKAVISGYEPRLEEIEVYQQQTIITRTIEPSRWSFGLQGGVYVTPKGLKPGIGFGAQYRLNFKEILNRLRR